MNTDSIDFCVRISLAHASLTLKLDDELGTHHGLSLADFILLRLLAMADEGRMASVDLVRPLGVQLSSVMREVVRLEKIGLVQRETSPVDSTRIIALRPAGRRVLAEALATAETLCAEALRGLPPGDLAGTAATLSVVCRTEALAV
jgi:MarR family transcriptional regulator, organic hydroperoxide resistance regulator